MPWFFPWTDTIKKKVCRYLLNKFLGNFLEHKISLDQLTVDFYNGTGTLEDIQLYCQAINELCEDQGWGVEVTDGHIGSVTVNIPWNALMIADSNIEVTGLNITFRPKARQTDGTSMLESMWSSMSSSMQLAQECLEKEGELMAAQANTMEGLERFAHTIENVLARIKARLKDTELRLQYVSPESETGVVLIIRIESIEYQNEDGSNTTDQSAEEFDEASGQSGGEQKILLSTYTTHHIKFEGITFYTEEFRIHDPKNKPCMSSAESYLSSDQFLSTINDLPDPDQQFQQFFSISNKTSFIDNNKKSTQVQLTAGGGDDVEDDERPPDSFENESNDGDEPQMLRTQPILVGRVANQLVLRVKMKQTEAIQGPKVELDLQMGAITMFLSPRQLHLLTLLGDIILNGGPVDISVQKENETDDRSEENENEEVQIYDEQHLRSPPHHSGMSGGIGLNNWSEEESTTFQQQQQSYFQQQFETNKAVSRTNDNYAESVGMSSMTSSMNSSTTYGSSSLNSQSTRRRRRRGIDADPNADISRLNLRIAAVAVILLHEDILVECSQPNDMPLSEQSVQKLQQSVDDFFQKVAVIVNYGLSAVDMAAMGAVLDGAVKYNHLRLLATPIIIEGEEQRNSSGQLLNLSISVARVDLREVMPEASSPLLEFRREKGQSSLPKRPEVVCTVKQQQQVLRGGPKGRYLASPKLDVNLTLVGCLSEFDISILDRLSAIFYQAPFVKPLTTVQFKLQQETAAVAKQEETKFTLKLETPELDLRLRFPIVDMRPIHDPERVPWWQRNIRPDFLLGAFKQLRLDYNQTTSTLTVEANEINIDYFESEIHKNGTKLGRSTMQENLAPKRNEPAFSYPRIVVEFPPDEVFQTKPKTSDEETTDDSEPTSGESITIGVGGAKKQKEQTPFCSKRVCRESDTPHAKQQTDDPETLLIPADTEEMTAFCETAMKTSRLQINLTLPVVSLQLKSKHLYELIYNRINTDLLMWEPCAPRHQPVPPPQAVIDPNSLLNIGMMESMYVPCKSGIQLDSSSSAATSGSESDSEGIYYSVYEKSYRQQQKRAQSQVASARTSAVDTSSAVAFRLDIGQGVMAIYVPVRDSLNHVIPGQFGEFIIKIGSGMIFSVNGFHANPNLGYLCIQAHSAELYHCGQVPTVANDPPLRLVGCQVPAHFKATLYPSPEQVSLVEKQGFPDREMLSLALQIKACPDQSVKRIRIATGIQQTTLRYHTELAQHTWLTQLLDMFDVVDYPIPGYTPMGVITEMHLHLWDVAIDYRPLYFGYRAVATLGSFMISSNIITGNAGCTLRFVAEDATLTLAPQEIKQVDDKSQPPNLNKITALPASELICVLEVGLFEISLRLSDKVTPHFPKFDLRAAINDVHVRTCADSGQALAQMIGYLAAEGDLAKPSEEMDETEDNMMGGEDSGEEELLTVKSRASIAPELTPSQQQHVNTLMAEAMEESLLAATNRTMENAVAGVGDQGVEVFFFPDEEKLKFTTHKRVASDDSISTEETLYENKYPQTSAPSRQDLEDDLQFMSRFDREDSESINTEMRELLDFESSVMGLGLKSVLEDDVSEEPLPQVVKILGDVKHIEVVKDSYGHQRHTAITQTRKISSDTDEDFCFIAEEERVQFPTGFGQPQQEPELTDDPIRIVDNHFSLPIGKPDLLKAPKDFPMATMRYTLCEMSLVWHMYGGSDFAKKDDDKAKESSGYVPAYKHLPMSEAYKVGVSYSKGSPTVTLGVSPLMARQTWKTRGGRRRKHDVLMEIHVNKVRFSHEIYPTNTEQASRQVLLITELEIRDRLAVSNINKFLYHPSVGVQSKGAQHMVVVKILHLRPDPALASQECCLRVSLLPLRLNIDQDSLLFLVTFFNELGGGADLNETASAQTTTNRRPSTTSTSSTSSAHNQPVMMVEIPEAAQELQARKMVNDNLLILMDDEAKTEAPATESVSEQTDDSPIYFRNIVFSPDVPIRLDYHGKRVELSHGPLAGLLMGLGQLQCSEIRLKRISYRHGILGIDKLFKFLLQEWLQDIKKKQLPKILGSVGPMHSVVQLFQGFWDLFWLPIEQYQKDGRIVRGLQRGAQSFTARTALAALEITTRIIYLLQITAETAYDLMSPGPSVRRGRTTRKGKRKRIHPPQDIREGVANACQIVREGIGETAHTIIETAAIEHDQKGYTGSVGAVMRQIPPTMIRPLVLATQATTNILGGVRNQLVPDARTEARQKWKESDDE